jgi:hypothetical protein
VCVCSLRYPAYSAHAPYCHLWPSLFDNIFRHYLKKGTTFKKKLPKTKCVFWFPLQLSSETFLILRRIERDMIKKYTLVFMYSTRYFCSILMTIEFSRQFFEEYSNFKFHENSSSGSRIVPCVRTDGETARQNEVSSRFSQFCRQA